MDIIDELAKACLRHETVLTIGSFDGVHRGHQALIGEVVHRARESGRLAALLTFHPHPAMVLAPHRAPRYLTTPGEKVALLEGLGVDVVVLLPFSKQMAATSASDFVQAFVTHLRVAELWVGADFALGRGREGDVPRLRALGQEFGFEVHVVEPVVGLAPHGLVVERQSTGKESSASGQVVSSSRIRALLAEGRVEDATLLLGRYPILSGEVVVGAQRGRTLGFPTANLEVRRERAVPADGVYAVFAQLGTQRHLGVANVGVRPSFDNGQRTVETHIFDFDQDIYGCDLVVEFVARLRDERRFEDIQDLVDQITQDSEAARQILSRVMLEAKGTRVLDTCPYRFEEIEHTADRALRVQSPELPGLFAGAARGMFSLMADLDGMVATEWRQVHLKAWDIESLLVDWLNELLFLAETAGLLFLESRIEMLSETELVAQAGSASGDVDRAHIKAATFHNLELRQDALGWSTVITLDV
jgi:riboflavin kinase/FMN adenylyltransferase